MKSYTDIGQSRKLAEILPLESADMHYNNGSCRGVDYTEHFNAELMPYQEALYLMKIHKTNFMFQVIPCWSLAALLGVLPDEITDDGDVYRNMFFHLKSRYIIQYPRLTTLWPSLLSVEADNPVDACYEMILKLHEQKLI